MSYTQLNIVMSILRRNGGKVASHAPASLLSRSPNKLLLAPEVAMAILFLPAGISAV